MHRSLGGTDFLGATVFCWHEETPGARSGYAPSPGSHPPVIPGALPDVRASVTLPSTVRRTPFVEAVDDGVDKVCASAVLSVDTWWTRLGIDVALLVVA